MLKKILILTAVLGLCFLEARVNDKVAQQIAKDKKYNDTIREFMAKNKKMEKRVYDSYAYAVFPSVGKGGLIFGYASGEGRVFLRGGLWKANTSVTQYTVGAQLGGSVYSEIIFFKTREALERFKKGEMEDSTQSSLVLFGGVSGDVNFDKDVEVFTISHGGFMLEGSTGTQVFEYLPKQ